jgi:glutathione-regulated potassium-efflux system ancillary protein KefG
MKKILIIFGHPRFENSKVHTTLLKAASGLENVTIEDLYEKYPNFNINVAHQQQLLLEHDIIILQHPVYWYSCPPIIKQWIDLVLTYGWAYGVGGNKLEGKVMLNVVSTGGSTTAYTKEGSHQHTLLEFFLPFKQTAMLCKLMYLPPFAVQGSHRLTEVELNQIGVQYQQILQMMQNDTINASIDFSNNALLNDFITNK